MADIGTTATALAMTIAEALYPNGLTSASVSGRRTIVRRGWVLNSDLTGACALKHGIDLVTVMPWGSGYQAVDRPLSCPWVTVSSAPCTVTLTASGNTLTVSIAPGVTPAGVVGAQVLYPDDSPTPSHTAISTAVSSTDTASDIALRLSQQIADAQASGAVVTFPAALGLVVQTGGIVTQWRITRRQRQFYRVSIWSGSWRGRDATGTALDGALADTRWIANTDGTTSQLEFSGAQDIDNQQTVGIFRRDIRYALTFDTLQTQTSAQMMFAVGQNNVVTNAGLALHTFGSVLPTIGVATDGGSTVYLDAAGNLVTLAQAPYSGLAMDANGNVVTDSAGNLQGFSTT